MEAACDKKCVLSPVVLDFLGVCDSSARTCDFGSENSIKSEFVPVFLNALRDQYPIKKFYHNGTSPVRATKNPEIGAKTDSDSAKRAHENITQNVTKLTPECYSNGTSMPSCSTQEPEVHPNTSARKHNKGVGSNGKATLGNIIQISMDRKGNRNLQKQKRERKKIKPQVMPNVDDLDAFPPLGGLAPRRITPTPVSVLHSDEKTKTGLLFSSEKCSNQNNMVFQSTPLKECRNICLQEERELLRKERKLQSQNLKVVETKPDTKLGSNDKRTSNNEPSKAREPTNEANIISEEVLQMVEPDPEKVTEKEKLDQIVRAYVHVVELNLVPNISAELYYLCQMLTIQIPVEKPDENNKNEGTKLFQSAHNCVYFAVSSLVQMRKRLMKILDGTTLKLLANNPNVQNFDPAFSKNLKSIDNSTLAPTLGFPSLEGVSFQPDTDSKENFPSDVCFQQFKKQRDLFYKLLLDWESHKSPDWSKEKHFEKQVHNILGLSTESTNYAHFARLFQMQMLVTCSGFGELDSKNPELLEELKKSHPIKYGKLHERFLTPSHLQGPCPAPSFPGSQQFFHDFLEVASSAALNQHLIDVMAAKIVELNKAEILPSDQSEDISDEIRNNVYSTIQILRLLGKFLGFLIFFPYQSHQSQSAELLSKSNSWRSVTQPVVHILSFLEKSIQENRKLLTVPWIVEYLSMMDPGAASLPYYQSVSCTLFRMYHEELEAASEMTRLYLQLLLGWLFDTPNFPQSLFFQYRVVKMHKSQSHRGQSNKYNLDAIDFVDHHLIYASCPHLIGLKALLKVTSTDSQCKNLEVRKITPIRAEGKTEFQPSAESLQQKLEEHFFKNQPSSIKSTVDFVSDRIRSKLVSHIRHIIVPKFEKATKICVHEVVGPLMKQNDRPSIRKSMLPDQELEILARKLLDRYTNDVRSYIDMQCPAEVKNVLLMLLPDDALEVIKEICCTICKRITKEKTNQWVKGNFTLQYIRTEIADECKRLCYKTQDTTSTVPSEECQRKPSLFTETTLDFIYNLQIFMTDSYANDVSAERIDTTVKQIKECLHHIYHSDVAVMQKMVKGFSVDLMMCLVVCHPVYVSRELISVFLEFWKICGPENLLSNIVSPRNLLLLSVSCAPVESCYAYEVLVGALLKNHVLSVTGFEAGCLNVMKQQWLQNAQVYFNAFLVRMHSIQNCWQPTQEFLSSDIVKNWSLATDFDLVTLFGKKPLI